LLHRLSGVALAIFLPMHFIALGTALGGADRLQNFLLLTHGHAARIAEWGLVTALALHMALGIRVLVIEWLSWRETSAVVVSGCVVASLAFGLLFLLRGM
jgi:fumarate reductase subunit D